MHGSEGYDDNECMARKVAEGYGRLQHCFLRSASRYPNRIPGGLSANSEDPLDLHPFM